MSKIKLGVDLGILTDLNDENIIKIYFYIKNGNLEKYYGENFDTYDGDIKRAEIINQIIQKE